MYEPKQTIGRWLYLALLVSAAGCGDSGDPANNPSSPDIPARGVLASLSQATDCDDLLRRIQDDAIAKLKLGIELAKQRSVARGGADERGTSGSAVDFGGSADEDEAAAEEAPSRAGSATTPRPSSNASVDSDDALAPEAPPAAMGPAGAKEPSGGVSADGDTTRGSNDTAAPTAPGTGPVGASETNKQVQEVDEADIVKVVQSGRAIFLLHGNTLRKLNSWPAAQTALAGMPLTIEGAPSEMFVSDAGKAVVFSSVPYKTSSRSSGRSVDLPSAPDCDGDCGYQGGNGVKITVANVAGDAPVVERELYYEGSYVSSRRYTGPGSDIVRAVVQSGTKFSGLFEPDIEWYDPWGRRYDQVNIDAQLAEWEARTTAAIRNTKLTDWLPEASEKRNGNLETLPPTCGSYFVPTAGLADYGLTHVLSIDALNPAQAAGGVTILGATSTVYSSAQELVLAQPDYRWNEEIDFGVESEQQTALHVFDLAGATTTYRASGWIPGHLPLRNPQFGIDVKDGVVRVATTGAVRTNPTAARTEPGFWRRQTRNLVVTARAEGTALNVIGKSQPLGHEGESVYSSRFLGDRAYLVTFRQTDPLIALDLTNPAAPTVLGELEIPGFSEYVHPLDPTHLITVGQSASRGIQLQLFDVTDPKNIPLPKVLDFGSGSSSEVSFQHKAFTFFEGVLAIPLSGLNYRVGRYGSALQLVRVDANAGFTHLGAIDHTNLYANNGAGVQCGVCDPTGCFNYRCGYQPEVRRGVFVKGDNATFVYSFSHAGVLVNDLANLMTPVASVGLPAPVGVGGSTYPSGGRVRGGGAITDPGIAEPPPDRVERPPVIDASIAPAPVDAGASQPADAGASQPADAGASQPADAGVL